MYAISGTYKLHRSNNHADTRPEKVRAICGTHTGRSYLSIVQAENVENYLNSPLVTKCKKCFEV